MSANKKSSTTVEEVKSTATTEIVYPPASFGAAEIKHIEALLEKAREIHNEIDAEQAKTALRIVWQGCHLFVVEDTLTAIEDSKIRDELYGKLLKKFGIARKTADQRVLLVKRMLSKKVLSQRILFNAEGDGTPSTELQTQLKKICANSKAVDLQREYGIRQPLKDREEKAKKIKPLSKQLEEMGKGVVTGLGKLEKLVDGQILDEAGLKILGDVTRACIHYQKAVALLVPAAPFGDKVAQEAIHSSFEQVTA